MKISAFVAISFNLVTLLVASSFSILRPVSSHVCGSGSIQCKNLVKLSVLSEPNSDDTRYDSRPIAAMFCKINAARDALLNVWKGPQKETRKVGNEAHFMSDDSKRNDNNNDGISPAGLENMWLKRHSLMDDKYTENVAVKMKLNITLDDFFTLFLSDDAPVSLESHHRAVGDSNVKSTQWETTYIDGFFAKKRNLTYKHSIKIPLAMAPPHGVATKTQTMHRFGSHGIYLDTETWINDVPLADCFYVADRLVVATHPEGGISLTLQFGNCFVKRTMFKKIINAASVKTVFKFHKDYIDSIGRVVNSSLRSSFGRSVQS